MSSVTFSPDGRGLLVEGSEGRIATGIRSACWWMLPPGEPLLGGQADSDGEKK
ncbi:MAG: hypothetical protein ACRC1K_27050 [Planctomycetia bacterium]